MYKNSRKILYLKCGNVINQFHDNNNGFYFSLYVKVPGRMGMIVMLYLISANVYNSVEANKNRGFSFIEVWMIGTQIPILLALCEYGFILYLKKVSKDKARSSVQSFLDKDTQIDKPRPCLDEKIKKLDFAAMIFSLFYFIVFACIYTIIVSM